MTIALAYAPGVSFGAVMHERFRPTRHRFVYRVATLRLPLARLEQIRVPLLGIDRPNLFSFLTRDHGARDGSPLLPWLRRLLEGEGLAAVVDGEVVLQTFPRLFGYVFNPVSFWFCHDRQGQLRAVLAEVSNTFGEHHNYLVHHADLRPIRSGESLAARKVFHVSPFFPVRGEYRFRFDFESAVQAVAIDYQDGGLPQLATRLGGRLAPLDGRSMLRWLLTHPFMTLAVVARIHWHALQLWLKKVPFFRKPPPPIEESPR